MKKFLSILSLAALTIGLLGSCAKIDERISNLEKRVDGIEATSIASVQQQIDGIKTSINDLKAADAAINGKIDELKKTAETQQTLIDALKEADIALGQKDAELEARIATLEGQVTTIGGQIETLVNADKAINTRIDELKSYVDTQIGNTKDWAEETFATLTQYEKTADDLAALSVTVTGISTTLAGVQTSISGLGTKIDGINTDLQGKITAAKTELEGKISSLKTELEGKITTAITASETSIKSWINGLLEGYYTAAQVDAKITGLNTAIDAAKGTAKYRIDSLATELTTLKKAVDTAKTAIRTEYKNAIDEAINKLDGEIRGALKDSILAVNGRIEALDTRVTTLEGKVLNLEGNVNKLLAMIQSVSITPAYSDGSVEAEGGILTLKCIVRPAEALNGMVSLKDSLLIYADLVKVKTKATPAYMEIKVKEASKLDAAQGVITLKADISEYLPEDDDKALTVALKIKNGISDFTTEFVPVYVAPAPVAPEGALKGEFTINADGKKVYFSKGNLYADGDKALHFEANQYAFNSSYQSAHVSHFTWSSTVEAAVGDSKSGDNLFCDESHKVSVDGDGAIYYALSKDEWTYLFNNHSYKWASVNDVKGYVIAPDGFSGELASSYADDAALAANNLVFLPAAGSRDGSNVKYVGEYGDYWSSSAYESNTAYLVEFSSEYSGPDYGANRISGFSVRLVTSGVDPKPVVPVTGVTLNKTELRLKVGKSETLVATVQPADATNKNVIWSSDNTGVATVGSTDGKVTAVAEGTATITAIVDGLFTATCTVTVKSLPAGALAGEFTVNADGKQVHFSKGNLWADGSNVLHFEDAQWKFTPASSGSWNGNHVSHFTWSDNVASAVASYNSGSNLFCDESHKVSVDGGEAIYYALSTAEWQYLINNNNDENTRKGKYKYGVTVCNKTNCLILVPDECLNGYSFDNTKTSYSIEEWATAEAAGLVCLPAAGYRFGINVYEVGDIGYYWSSSAIDEWDAYSVFFSSDKVDPGSDDTSHAGRNTGCSVRLITMAE